MKQPTPVESTNDTSSESESESSSSSDNSSESLHESNHRKVAGRRTRVKAKVESSESSDPPARKPRSNRTATRERTGVNYKENSDSEDYDPKHHSRRGGKLR